jgi:hypothetical protein
VSVVCPVVVTTRVAKSNIVIVAVLTVRVIVEPVRVRMKIIRLAVIALEEVFKCVIFDFLLDT